MQANKNYTNILASKTSGGKSFSKIEEFRQFILSHISSGARVYAILVIIFVAAELGLVLWLDSIRASEHDNLRGSSALLALVFLCIVFSIYRYARARMPKRTRAYKLLIETPTLIKSIRLQVLSDRYTFIITKHDSTLPQLLTFTSKNQARQFRSYVSKLLPQVELS